MWPRYPELGGGLIRPSDDLVGQVTALVVDEHSRGRGVARLPTQTFEDWAAAQGATKASLTSSSAHDGAHAMYERLGWHRTDVRFAKNVG
jgi:GNAT superfamily N-acetyltransferase